MPREGGGKQGRSGKGGKQRNSNNNNLQAAVSKKGKQLVLLSGINISLLYL